MKTVGAYQAKTHLSQLLERVINGEQIIITKHGVPVAVLQPPAPEKRIDTKAVIASIRKFRDKHSLDGLTIREMLEEGRR